MKSHKSQIKPIAIYTKNDQEKQVIIVYTNIPDYTLYSKVSIGKSATYWVGQRVEAQEDLPGTKMVVFDPHGEWKLQFSRMFPDHKEIGSLDPMRDLRELTWDSREVHLFHAELRHSNELQKMKSNIEK